MAVDLLDELRALLATLDEQGLEYALVGALALAVHGAPRATTDIDLIGTGVWTSGVSVDTETGPLWASPEARLSR